MVDPKTVESGLKGALRTSAPEMADRLTIEYEMASAAYHVRIGWWSTRVSVLAHVRAHVEYRELQVTKALWMVVIEALNLEAGMNHSFEQSAALESCNCVQMDT